MVLGEKEEKRSQERFHTQHLGRHPEILKLVRPEPLLIGTSIPLQSELFVSDINSDWVLTSW